MGPSRYPGNCYSIIYKKPNIMTAKQRLESLEDPFSDKANFESEVSIALQCEALINDEQAEAMVEDHQDIIDDCWVRKIGPSRTAKRILKA
jgi:hypothetical protein